LLPDINALLGVAGGGRVPRPAATAPNTMAQNPMPGGVRPSNPAAQGIEMLMNMQKQTMPQSAPIQLPKTRGVRQVLNPRSNVMATTGKAQPAAQPQMARSSIRTPRMSSASLRGMGRRGAV